MARRLIFFKINIKIANLRDHGATQKLLKVKKERNASEDG
jgi:hypothetical protein